MATPTDPALAQLLASDEPAIRHAALTVLLDRPPDDQEVLTARASIPAGRWVSQLLAGQQPDGGFGNHPYAKWSGAHWRLAALMQLHVPRELPGLAEAHDTVLRWLLAPGHIASIQVIEGRARRCASQEGNALAVGAWLGRADDQRVRQLAANLVGWQWPDGGWNCDVRPAASHSSFNETWQATIGLARFAQQTGDADARVAARSAADRAADFLLRHGVVFSERTGDLAHPRLATLFHPPYWHYDLLAGLRALAAAGTLRDARSGRALDLLEARRKADGAWHTGGRHWQPTGKYSRDVADWGTGRSDPLTLAALEVLKAAGRWKPPRSAVD